MNIQLVNLQKQYKELKPQIDKAIHHVIEKQSFILGEELQHFEKEFAQYLGVKYFVGVGSGTDGLILSLLALGVGRGDEVITPANSFIATASAISFVGATPVFVDINPDTYQLNLTQVEKKITKKTKVILPVHLYGASCDMRKLTQLAKKRKVFLVEDACQAHGSLFDGKRLGSFGDVGVFSFYPSKNLGAYGDGGGIAINNKKIYEKLLGLRSHGERKKYFHQTLGINSRLDELHAVVLRVKLSYLDSWNEMRRKHAEQYAALLPEFKIQKFYNKSISNYYVFTIEHPDRDGLRQYLEKCGIKTQIYYPIPIHLQKCYNYLGYSEGDFPITERIAKSILSLPMYPELTEKEIAFIVTSIKRYTRK